MSLTLDQKVAKFTSIMKNAGYLNMNHYTIKSLLEIPESWEEHWLAADQIFH